MVDKPTWQDLGTRPHPGADAARETVSNDDTRTAPVVPQEGDHTTAPASARHIGRYVVLRPLGRGGFGCVFLARDPCLDRLVAIKLAKAMSDAPEGWQEVFLREARTIARLKHPHIVSVYDAGEYEGGVYIAMEYIDGGSLRDRVAKGALPLEEALRIMVQVADAVHYAHKRGLVHCDLKPANILLDRNGSVKVADFGLALWEEARHARRGELSGTPAYMAPEQVKGKLHYADGRADVWALGVILYELLTGKRPFTGDDREQIYDEVLHREPKPLRQVDESIPVELDELCARCLRKDVSQRLPTAHDLKVALTQSLQKVTAAKAQPRRLNAAVLLSLLVGTSLLLTAAAATAWRLAALAPTTKGQAEERGNRYRDLLADNPIPIMLDVTDPANHHYTYSPIHRTLNVLARTPVAFKLGELPGGPCTLRYTMSATRRPQFGDAVNPRAITFWGVLPVAPPDAPPRMLAPGLYVEYVPDEKEVRVALCHITLQYTGSGGLYVRKLAIALQKTVTWNVAGPVTVRVRLNWGRPDEVVVQGQRVPLKTDLPEVPQWEQHDTGSVGMMFMYGQFSVSGAGVRTDAGGS